MKIISADITGSLIINNQDVTTTVESSSIWSGSIASRVTNLEQFSSSLDATFATDQELNQATASLSSSIAILSGSYLTTSASFVVVSGSYSSASGSLSTRTTTLEQASASFSVVSQSYSSASGSLSTRVTTLETASGSFAVVSQSYSSSSGSFSTRVTTLEAASSSLNTASGSFSTRVTTIESKYATTGSNTFTGVQYINHASNAIGFTSTASIYTDGGMRVTKDAFVSGTLYLNNLTVYGTSSIQYVTSSQLNVATNVITVNTNTPSVRFGGLTVFDSGSLAGTGSLFWDSQNDRWVYSNPSGSTYDGGMLISGPRNTTGLGNEIGTTACALMMGQGGDHITSSGIFSYGNATCFYGQSYISSSGLACFSGTVCAPIHAGGTFTGTTVYGSTVACSPVGCFTTSCASSFVGGTVSGTTLYGSTAACAPTIFGSTVVSGSVGCFLSTCSPTYTGGTFSGTVVSTTTAVCTVSGGDYWRMGVYNIEGHGNGTGGTWSIGTNSNDNIGFITNNTQRIKLDNNGVACFSSTVCAPQMYIDSTTSAILQVTTSTNADCCSIVSARWSGGTGIRMYYHPNSAVGVVENTYQASAGQVFGDILFRHNVGGTQTTRLRLQADGGIACFSGTVCAGTLSSTGDVIAYASDCRLKDNIKTITNPIDRIKCINGVTYSWKDGVECLGFNPSSKEDVGVLAQEVQKVLPEVVRHAPFDHSQSGSKSGENYLTVKYEKIVPLLIEAIKEQQCQIEYLKCKIG
jgi:hypothetical protein